MVGEGLHVTSQYTKELHLQRHNPSTVQSFTATIHPYWSVQVLYQVSESNVVFNKY